MSSRVLHLAAVVAVCGLLAFPATAVSAPNPQTNWLSLINHTHQFPTDMSVVIVPPAYDSYQAYTRDLGWIGPNILYEHPGTQAILEAVEYWTWMIDQYETQYPHLAKLSYTVSVLGVDATEEDLKDAEIVVVTAMSAEPSIFQYHLGLGLPTYPAGALLGATLTGNRQTQSQQICTVINTGFGDLLKFNVNDLGEDDNPARLRNLVIHEFGHCLGVGHTGTSLGLQHTSSDGTVFESHPDDVMSSVVGTGRQCLSNLNVKSLAVGYHWLAAVNPVWKSHAGETFMLRSDYATTCMPSSMNRF